jgi:hypothetical protein
MFFIKSKRYKNLSQSWHVKLVSNYCCQLEKNSYCCDVCKLFQDLKVNLHAKINGLQSWMNKNKLITYIGLHISYNKIIGQH